MMRRTLGWTLIGIAVLISGCGDSNEHGSARKGSKSDAPQFRETLEGTWLVRFTFNEDMRQLSDVYPMIVRIAKSKDGFKVAKTVFASDLSGPPEQKAPKPVLTTETLTKDDLHFAIEVGPDRARLDFAFHLQAQDGFAHGNVLVNNFFCFPAALLPVEGESLKNVQFQQPAMGAEDLMRGLQQAKDAFAYLGDWSKANEDSPLATMALLGRIGATLAQDGESKQVDAAVAAAIANAKAWGPRYEQYVHMKIAQILASNEYDPATVFRHIDKTEKSLDESSPEAWSVLLDASRSNARIVEAKHQIESSDKELQAQGETYLTEIRKERPFQPDVTFSLARYYEREGEDEKALGLFAELKVLPLLELMLENVIEELGEEGKSPSDMTAEIWKRVHGSEEGLEEYLDKVYTERLTAFAGTPREPRTSDEGGRLALFELFTGAQCQPCIAADAALSAIERTYGPDRVVALRYHQHLPGPDPLANDDTEARFYYYGYDSGTPTLAVNGRAIRGFGGGMAEAPARYNTLKEMLEPILSAPPQVRVAASAKIINGQLKVTAAAQRAVRQQQPKPDSGEKENKTESGNGTQGDETTRENGADKTTDAKQTAGADDEQKSPKEKSDDAESKTPEPLDENALRLRVVLAEKEVPYLGSNHIRHHHMVVRKLIGGAEGIAWKDGGASLEETIDLVKLRQELADYLANYERGRDYEFDAKPLPMQGLYVVAFVQNDKTKEVLQAVSIPVAGTVEYPPLKQLETSGAISPDAKDGKTTKPQGPALGSPKDQTKAPKTGKSDVKPDAGTKK